MTSFGDPQHQESALLSTKLISTLFATFFLFPITSVRGFPLSGRLGETLPLGAVSENNLTGINISQALD